MLEKLLEDNQKDLINHNLILLILSASAWATLPCMPAVCMTNLWLYLGVQAIYML